MLKYIDKNGKKKPLIEYSDLCIEEVLDYGDKTLTCNVSMKCSVALEDIIRTRTNEYVIKQKNGLANDGTYTVTAKLNIDELEGTPFISFDTTEKTALEAAQLALAGTGWTCECDVKKKRTIRMTNASSWEILKKIVDTYMLEMQIDSINKVIRLKEKIGSYKGAYFTDQINLISLESQANTNDFYTRIYPIGKDGLTIESVNNGSTVLENHIYSSKNKTYIWKDERYTDPQSLKEDAAEKLADMAQPYIAYSCSILDLSQNSKKYKNYNIGDEVVLIDSFSKTKIKQRIKKISRYPDDPSKDTCEIANLKLTFTEMQQKLNDAADTVNNITTDNGTVDGSSIDDMDANKLTNVDDVVSKTESFKSIKAEVLTVTGELQSASGKIGELETNKLDAETARITYATIENLKSLSGEFEQFKTNDFTAITGKVNDLTVGVEKVNTLMFGSASGGSLTTEFSNSVISLIGDAQIKSAMIESIDAKKITSLDVNTTSVNIHSESGLSRWKDNTIVISDGTRTRVQIGKDANADYNMYVWDKAGNLMFDALGLTEKGVKREIIRNDMVKEDANISAGKLDIASLFAVINNDGSHTLKSSKIYVDSDKQTLDVSFKTITTKTNTAVEAANKAAESADNALSTANSADTKAQSVLNRANAGEFKGADGKNFSWNLIKYDYIEAFASDIDKSEYIKNGKVICEGNNVNAGIKIDSVNCYESSTQYVLSGYVTILSKTCINFFIYNGKKHTFISFSIDGKSYANPLDIITTDAVQILNDGKSHFFELRFQTANDMPADDNTKATYTYIQLNKSNQTNIRYQIVGLKLEKGNKSTDWCPAKEDLKGATGATGKGVSAITPQYYLSTSNTTQSGGSWSNTRPSWVAGRYYWMRDYIQWTDGSVTASAPQLATDLNNLYSSLQTVTNTVSSQGTQLSTVQGQISSKVWQQDITTAVTNLQIGGRNLLTGSAGWTKANPAKSTNAADAYAYIGGKVYLENGKTYTLQAVSDSVWATGHGGQTGKATIWLHGLGDGFHRVFCGDGKTSGRYTWTFVHTSATQNCEIRINGYSKVTSFWDIKIESGNKATDWTPAPEDIDANISSVEGKITTVSNQYTTLNQSFTSLKATVNSNTTAISKKADNSTVTEINNRVTTLTADLSGIKQSISATYVTKTEYAKEIDRLGDNINNVDDKASAAQDWCQTIEDNITDHYSTTVQMNNAITQAVSAESNSIKLEVSATYATKNDINNLQIGGVNRFIKSTATTNKYITATGTITDGGNYWDLTDYINVSKWTHYIASGWTNLGNAPATCFYDSNKKFISGVAGNNTSARYSLPIPTGAAYMRFSYAHVDTDKLKIEKGTKATDYSPAPEDVNAKFNNYATTASLSAYIAKTDTGALKSCIEAIADDINLTAGGSINISGNKSVNIRGNTFSLDSSGTKISNTGYLQTVNAKLGEWNVDSKAIYCETADKVYTAYLQNPDYVVGNTREDAWVYSVQKNGIATFYVTSEGDLYCRCFSTPYTTYQPNYRWATYENNLNTTLFIRTFHGPCLIIANVSIWTDDTSDYGTIKCGLYLDGYCVTENQHRLETTNAIELSAGATYVWYFSDNEAHTLSGIGGSTKNGKKTITYSVQALFNNDVGWGTGQ